MAILRTYERVTYTPAYALNVTDRFAWEASAHSRIAPATGDIAMSVTNRLQPSALTFDPPLDLIAWRNRGGFLVTSGEARTPGDAAARMLPQGTYRVRIDSPYYQAATIDLVWPPAEVYVPGAQHDLALDPAPGYPFPDLTVTQRGMAATLVRGSLFQRGGPALEGIAVTLTAPVLAANRFVLFNSRTDAQGNWTIAILQIDPAAPMPNFANANVHVASLQPYDVPIAIVPGAINVKRQTALRGRVVTPQGRPIAGAQIATTVAPGFSPTDRDGNWFFYFDLAQTAGPVTVTATAPNGHVGQQATQIVVNSTVLVPAITIP